MRRWGWSWRDMGLEDHLETWHRLCSGPATWGGREDGEEGKGMGSTQTSGAQTTEDQQDEVPRWLPALPHSSHPNTPQGGGSGLPGESTAIAGKLLLSGPAADPGDGHQPSCLA